MHWSLSRRGFLKASAAASALLATGIGIEGCAEESPKVIFFSAHDRDTLAAAARRLLPSDRDLGAVNYIERLLTAFEHDPPLIFAGGPFSGRHPYPDITRGEPSHDYPAHAFARFLPLSRAKEIAWRVRIYGSQNVAGGDFNDALLGPTKGWRQAYQEGLPSLDAKSRELFAKSFVALAPDEQDRALLETDQAFVGVLFEHVIEAAYAVPEYGGNRDLAGWKSVKFDGDSQPLGYSIYDASSDTFHELRDRPLSTANPDEDYSGFSPTTIDLLEKLAKSLNGKRFL